MDNEGKRHGIWKKNYDGTNVTRYEGEFFHGKEIGIFKFYKNIDKKAALVLTKMFNKENNIADVEFFSDKGKRISKGQMNGKAYVGNWEYYQEANGKIIIKEFYDENGVLQNERLLYYDDGVLAEKQHYKDGKLHGIYEWYSSKGNLVKVMTYENGEIHGLIKEYESAGKLKVEGQYQHDRKHGIWKFYEDGKLVNTKDFTRRSKNPYKKKP
jgi:antitoxin component YwqK of YwqJK toxin-antitoxin module